MIRPALLIAASLLAFGALAVVWYGWSGESDDADTTVQNASPTPQSTRSAISVRLGAPNRDRLAICVDVVGEGDYLRFIATERVRQALGKVSEGGPYWFSEPQPVVDAGCPQEPALDSDLGRFTESPSFYSLWVFVVSNDHLDRFGRTSGFTEEEFMGEGDVFWGGTEGLYMTPQEMCDEELIASALAFHLGRTREYPQLGPTPYFDPPPKIGITPSPSPTPCY